MLLIREVLIFFLKVDLKALDVFSLFLDDLRFLTLATTSILWILDLL